MSADRAKAAQWFPSWINHHHQLFVHLKWIDPASPAGLKHYAGWIDELADAKATYDLACRASIEMLRRDDLQNSTAAHLVALRDIVRALKSRYGPAPVRIAAAEHRARLSSVGCPECACSGFAHRKAQFVWFRYSPFTLRLYCRCALGRYWCDAGQAEKDGPAVDDLQAIPELWDAGLSHPNWSDQPTRRSFDPFAAGDGRDFAYLRPGDGGDEKDRPPGSVTSNPGGRPKQGSSPAAVPNPTMNRSSRQC